jgi:hypothetical protein
MDGVTMADSTFGERFTFARLWQSMHHAHEQDADFAKGIGKSKGAVSGYRRQRKPPPAETVSVMAPRMGVDAGWLTFGKTGAPDGFAEWLERLREDAIRLAAAKVPRHGVSRSKRGAIAPAVAAGGRGKGKGGR